MYNKIIRWANENNVQITWFLIGTLLSQISYELANHNFWQVGFNAISIMALYFTRNYRFKVPANG